MDDSSCRKGTATDARLSGVVVNHNDSAGQDARLSGVVVNHNDSAGQAVCNSDSHQDKINLARLSLREETEKNYSTWGALDDEETAEQFLNTLPDGRRHLGMLLNTGAFEITLCLVILFNAVIAIFETDATADGADAPNWIIVTNIVLLVIYSIEIVLRLFVYHWYYFRSPWNLLDLSVVLLDVILNILRTAVGDIPNVSVLRTLRLIRLARAYRVIVLFPELHIMVMGLAGTIKTVLWGLVLLTGFLAIFALVAVQLIHPINKDLDWTGCQRCPRAFGSCWEALLTFLQQVVAGDSWGTVTMPIIEAEPWTVFFFLAVLITINLLVVNLILAVVVDKAQQAHQQDQAEVVRCMAKQKEEHHAEARTHLIKMCTSMDRDESGCLTLPELLEGYDHDEFFASSLKAMDIDREDIAMVFNILDKDGSGDIDYAEFVDQLHKLKNQDTHTLLIFVLHHVKEIEHLMKRGRNPVEAMAAIEEMPPQGAHEPTTDLAQIGKMVEQAQKTLTKQAQLLQGITAAFSRLQG